MFTLEQNVIGVLVGGHRRIAVHAHLEFRKFLAACLEVLCVGRKFHDFGFGVKGSVALAPAAASWISAATASGCETYTAWLPLTSTTLQPPRLHMAPWPSCGIPL